MNKNDKLMKLNLQHFAKAATTTAADIAIQAREIDFVTRFNLNWDALRQILGIMRPIRKTPNTQLVSYTAKMKSASLQGGASVAEGDEIPYTEFEVVPTSYGNITVEKYAKAVTIEAVEKHGADNAVSRTDEAFLNELQKEVMGRFFTFMKTGSLTAAYSTFQMALAMAKGLVIDKFNKLRRNVTEVVGFANVLDVYEYIGAANITVQTQFGFQYVKDFLGYSTIFLMSDPDIPRDTVIAIPADNIDLYYIDPSDSDFARLGLQYTVQGETNLIGFHVQGKYSHAVGEAFALMGMTLWAEYLDGIAVVNVGTESFTAVETTTGKNPAAEMWYEKDASNNYFRTIDTTPAAGKTYYTRTVTATGA